MKSDIMGVPALHFRRVSFIACGCRNDNSDVILAVHCKDGNDVEGKVLDNRWIIESVVLITYDNPSEPLLMRISNEGINEEPQLLLLLAPRYV